jgi:hypothetical protein
MGGYFVLLRFQQEHIRKDVEQKIKSEIPFELLHTFIFSNDEFENINWERPNKEFISNNTLFDIVKHEIKGNKHILLCLDDKQETHVKQILEQQKNKNNDLAIYQLLLQLYDIPLSSIYLFPLQYSTEKTVNFYFSINYISALQDILLPPPEGIIMS